MKVFCLSGLGVDHRVFAYLDVPGIELVDIPWITPLPSETLEQYAVRLFENAALPVDYCLLGVSFGGIVAQEFAKIHPPRQLLLISTLTDTADLPFVFRLAKVLRLHRIVPASVLKRANVLTYWFFGVKEKSEKQLLKHILRDTDPVFLKWAMNAVLYWKNRTKPSGTMIHGSKDRMLPVTQKADHIVEGGGHFMIVTHAEALSSCINSQSVMHNS